LSRRDTAQKLRNVENFRKELAQEKSEPPSLVPTLQGHLHRDLKSRRESCPEIGRHIGNEVPRPVTIESVSPIVDLLESHYPPPVHSRTSRGPATLGSGTRVLSPNVTGASAALHQNIPQALLLEMTSASRPHFSSSIRAGDQHSEAASTSYDHVLRESPRSPSDTGNTSLENVTCGGNSDPTPAVKATLRLPQRTGASNCGTSEDRDNIQLDNLSDGRAGNA
jgi:hypothetical protein